MLAVEKVRELFPYIKKGKIYFNHASTGPISLRVLNRLSELLKERSEDEMDDYTARMQAAEESKNILSEMINCDTDRLAFVDNTSNGINIVAQGVRWKKGDRVLLNDLEFPANVYPFLNLEKEGVIIDFIKSMNGRVTADDVIANIKEDTRLVAISYVQFLTGYRADLQKIGGVCKEKGIIFSVDGIQGLGAIRPDVKKYNIDFLSAGTQKWLLGLQGAGFIYISKKLQDEIEPKFVGWLGVKDAWNLLSYDLTFLDTAERFQTGTINTFGLFAVHESLKLFKEFGFDEAEKNVLSNSRYLIESLQGIGIDPILKDCSDSNIAGIVSFKHQNAGTLFKRLSEKNVVAAMREGMVRLSPHFYNTREEIDKVIEILKELQS